MCICLDFFTGSDSIQGTWCKDILQTIMSFTPHNWASHTLSCFPAPLQVIVSNLGLVLIRIVEKSTFCCPLCSQCIFFPSLDYSKFRFKFKRQHECIISTGSKSSLDNLESNTWLVSAANKLETAFSLLLRI